MADRYMVVAEALRDLMHESPLNRCDQGSDTCETWPLAYEWADKVILAVDGVAIRETREDS